MMLEQRSDLILQSGSQSKLRLEDANMRLPEIVAQHSLSKTTNDFLSSESQLWADRVDQLLSETVGLDEYLQ